MGIQSENFARLFDGAELWNNWVDEQIASWKELHSQGDGQSDAARAIVESLDVVAVGQVFADTLDLQNYHLPSGVTFVDCDFKNGLDLSNSRCGPIKLIYCQIDERFEASNAAFAKNVLFNYCTFSGVCDFQEAQFSSLTTFAYSTFKVAPRFDRCRLNTLDFPHASFWNGVSFQGAVFEAGIMIDGANFSANTDNEGQVKGCADFSECTFEGIASFGGVRFDEANFSDVKFNDMVDFSHAKFSDNASFDASVVAGVAFFDGAVFAETASFRQSQFKDSVRFRRVELSGLAYFDGVNIGDDFDLADTKFEFSPDYAGCCVAGNLTIPHQPELDLFSEATVQGAMVVRKSSLSAAGAETE